MFAQRPYDLTVYVASPTVIPLWYRQQWNKLVPALGPLVITDRGRTVVDSLQTNPTAAAAKERIVKFGAMFFTEASHQRWTHDASSSHEFSSVDIWAPGRLTCHRQGTAPETFVTVHAADSAVWWVLVATAADRPQPHAALAHQTLTDLLEPDLIAIKRRPWGISVSEAVYSSPVDSVVPVRPASAGGALAELIDDETTGAHLQRWQRLPPSSVRPRL